MKQDYEAALTQQLAQIGPLDQRAMEEAQRRWDSSMAPWSRGSIHLSTPSKMLSKRSVIPLYPFHSGRRRPRSAVPRPDIR